MPTTPDGPARTWRDLADQLTPEQIAELEAQEHDLDDEPDDRRLILLGYARGHAQRNLTEHLLGLPPPSTIPLPAGATTRGWDTINPDGISERGLEWSRRDLDKGNVAVDGWQDAKGTVTRGISFYGMVEGERLTAVQAREFARALLAAADELDQLDS